jgi:hypothetical protein
MRVKSVFVRSYYRFRNGVWEYVTYHYRSHPVR